MMCGRFDTESELWCEVTLCLPVSLGRLDLSSLLRDMASKSTVIQVKGIRRAFTYTAGDKLMFKVTLNRKRQRFTQLVTNYSSSRMYYVAIIKSSSANQD